MRGCKVSFFFFFCLRDDLKLGVDPGGEEVKRYGRSRGRRKRRRKKHNSELERIGER